MNERDLFSDRTLIQQVTRREIVHTVNDDVGITHQRINVDVSIFPVMAVTRTEGFKRSSVALPEIALFVPRRVSS